MLAVMPADARPGASPTRGADFRLLGPVEVAVDGRAIALGGAKQRALLALFVLHANEVLSRDFLIDELWGDRAPASAAHSIVVYVSRLRRALDALHPGNAPVLDTEGGGYVLRVDPDHIDVRRFERALERGGRALADGDACAAADILRSACAEWRGEPLSDLVSAPFVEGASWRLAELRLTATGSRIDADLALGKHAELVAELELLVRQNPLNERLCAQLMVALYRSGRQVEALGVYRTTRRSLVDELGIEPAEDLQRLQGAILRHDPDLEAPVLAAARPGPDPPLRSPAAARRQRKTVSVLVARVAPVANGGRPDPEALRLAMTGYFRTINAAIERHGGTVAPSLGDATLGIFGVPMVHEDDPLRAVRAAAEVRAAVDGATDTPAGCGVALQLGIGIETGPVLTDSEASAITGRAVAVATALAEIAEAGQTILGPTTQRLVADAVMVDSCAKVVVRGEADPVAAFRLERLVAVAEAETDRVSLDLGFVGRAEELQELRVAFDQAVAEGRPQLVTVVGEPGIGKTRLLAEFTSKLARRARVLRGRCLPYGDGITYWPLAGVVRDLGGPDALAALLPSDDEGERIRALLRGAVGAGAQTGSVEEVQWAIRRLLETIAREMPVVVVLDDLHWAQPTFLQLVEYVVSCSGGAAILIVVGARDELLELRPTWAYPVPNARILPLRALSEPDALALIDRARVGPPLSESRLSEILEAAAGNPLFIDQLLAEERGRAGADEELVIPATLQALLAARIDRLPAAERNLLEAAAVEGVTFHRGVVTDLLPAEERAAAAANLLGVIRRNLVRPEPADRSGDEALRFVHVLVRDAVYQSMPKELRASLHERVAAWLEGHGGTLLGRDEVLGYHLEQAARYRRELGLPDEGLGERAAERLAAAGRRALWRDDAAAASLLGRALELTRQIRVDVRLEVDLASAVGLLDPDRAGPIADAAADQARASGDDPGGALARVIAAHERLLAGGGDMGRLESLVRAAIPKLEAVGDHAGLARVWWILGFDVANMRLRHDQMTEAFEQALVHGRLAGQPTGDLLGDLGMAIACGDLPADAALRKVDVLLRDDPHPKLLLWRAYLLAMLDRLAEARPSPRELAERMRETGSTLGEGVAGMIATLEGDHETAARDLRVLCDVVEVRGQRGFLAGFAPLLGRSLCALERYDEAEPLAQQGRELGDTHDRITQMLWRQVQALVAGHRGAHEEAERLAREAVAIGERTDGLNDRAAALCDLAEVLGLAGNDAGMTDALDGALRLYERKKNLPTARRVRARMSGQRPSAVPVTRH